MSSSRRTAITLLLGLFVLSLPSALRAATIAEQQKGYILIQVQQQGQAWYVYPKDMKRYYLGRPSEAFDIMRKLGRPISNADLEKIPVSTSSATGDTAFRQRMSGYIVLQVQKNGGAWYIYPKNQKRYYLGRPAEAFAIMRSLGRGITDDNLARITVGEITGTTTQQNDTGVKVTSRTVVTERGSFAVDQLTFKLGAQTIGLQTANLKLMTDTGNDGDCATNCAAYSLGTYVSRRQAIAGIHGSYFCPPEYSTCGSQINYYFYPVYNSFTGTMVNASRIKYTTEPMVVVDTANKMYYFTPAKQFKSYQDFRQRFADISEAAGGTGIVQATISNGPGLVESGKNAVSHYGLDSKQSTVKSYRGAIGWKGDTIYLFVVKSATVIDSASVATKMGLDYALNLDGGGSTALYHDGQYILGPGRPLPNVLLLIKE